MRDEITRLAERVEALPVGFFQSAAQERDDIATELRALARMTDNLVPGVMHCAKCKFRLHRTTLYMGSGTTGPGDNKTEPCPNGCGPLWPVTWEQEAREAMALVNGLHEQLQAAQQQGKPDHAEDKLGMVPIKPGNWPEDSSHENGNYECKCCHCGATFYGHKRRVTCKVCASPAPDHSAGVGGVVVDDALIDRYQRTYMQNYVDGRLLKVPERIRRALTAALAQPADADAEGGK